MDPNIHYRRAAAQTELARLAFGASDFKAANSHIKLAKAETQLGFLSSMLAMRREARR